MTKAKATSPAAKKAVPDLVKAAAAKAHAEAVKVSDAEQAKHAFIASVPASVVHGAGLVNGMTTDEVYARLKAAS